jgi:hypothetical protein
MEHVTSTAMGERLRWEIAETQAAVDLSRIVVVK